MELKYALDEDALERVRRFVAPFVVEDPAVASAGGQRVTSLYLDTPRGDFCARHLAREADRFKLRVRRYGDDEPLLVYFEVKRKIGRVTDKRRACVWAAHAPLLLAAGPAAALEAATRDAGNLRLFLWLMMLHRAAPRLLVTCRREAYVGPEPACEARVTFDHDVSFQPARTATLRGDPARWLRTPLAQGSVLLELKYSGASPWWMAELARRLGRRRTAYSKYVAGAAVAGATRLAPYAGLEVRA